MKSHFYLLRKTLLNMLKEIARKPGLMALYIIILLGIGASLLGTLLGAARSEASLPLAYLTPIFGAFLLLFYAMAIQKGLSAGDTLFSMSDVNLLFVSPVNPRATLLYGLLRMAGMSFWAGFFLLFQGGNLAHFGIAFGGVLLLFGVFMLNMMALTLLSLVVYNLTNGRPGRKRLVRVLSAAVFVPLLAFAAVTFLQTGDPLATLDAVVTSPVLAATPFVGWASAGAIAVLGGDTLAGFGLLGLLVLTGAGMFAYILFSRSDYYEDVLVATETAFEKKRAAAEGDVMANSANAAGKVKVKQTGLGGRGARVFLYKHLRESFRQNRFGFFSLYMVIMTAGMTALAFFLRGETDVTTPMQIVMWTQIFMIGTGRGLYETYSHYIYMIPASAFRKLLWGNMELMLRSLVEGVLFIGIPGIVMGSHPLVILSAAAVYVCFSFMLMGVNYLSMRVLSANLSVGLLLIAYTCAAILFAVPGVAGALIVGIAVGGVGGALLGLTILWAWCLLVGLVCFALSKDVLHKCDMPTAKKQ